MLPDRQSSATMGRSGSVQERAFRHECRAAVEVAVPGSPILARVGMALAAVTGVIGAVSQAIRDDGSTALALIFAVVGVASVALLILMSKASKESEDHTEDRK